MFVGHVSDLIPNLKKPLLQYNKTKTLANENGQYYLYNNICPHQGSLILTDKSDKFVCRYHGWGWDDHGNPTGHGSTDICNNFKLRSKSACVANNLLFSDHVDISHLNFVDLSYMRLVEERIDTLCCSYKNIIDVFLDVDHIPVLHTGVYDSIGITDKSKISWIYSNESSTQLVYKDNTIQSEFSKTLLGIEEEKTFSSFWYCLYPYTMIEWQPGSLFVTICLPENNSTNVLILKYKDIRYGETNWNINHEIWETAWSQDKKQSESIVLYSDNATHLEESKMHFRRFLQNIKKL